MSKPYPWPEFNLLLLWDLAALAVVLAALVTRPLAVLAFIQMHGRQPAFGQNQPGGQLAVVSYVARRREGTGLDDAPPVLVAAKS